MHDQPVRNNWEQKNKESCVSDQSHARRGKPMQRVIPEASGTMVGGVECRPTGGLADGEEAAHALNATRRADVAPRALCAIQRRTGQIHPMVALRIIAGPGGMTRRFFPVPI
jgi:hypothetical protein